MTAQPPTGDPRELQLLEQLTNLRVDHQLGEPAAYQQVVLLWAISRALDGKPRLVRFSSVANELAGLLANVAVGKTPPDPAFPWFALDRIGWWELDLAPGTKQPGARGRDLVRRHDPQAGLTSELYRRVGTNFAFRDRAVELLAAQVRQHPAGETVLVSLGFAAATPVQSSGPASTVNVKSPADWDIAVGDVLVRRDLHARYGGAWYGGMEPSSKTPNVFLFSNEEAGKAFGYNYDGWAPDGSYHYTGEGQVGDQTFTHGNKAVLDHVADGRALRLFQSAGTSVRYLGEFAIDAASPYDLADAPDRNGDPRVVIVFHLLPVGEVQAPTAQATVPQPSVTEMPTDISIEDYAASATEPSTHEMVEAKLQERYRSWLQARGHQVCRHKVVPAGELHPLYTDLYDKTVGELIEVKGSSNRDSVRLALGQILDYARHVEHRTLAVLVPTKPRPDLLNLLTTNGVGCVWEDGNSFSRQEAETAVRADGAA